MQSKVIRAFDARRQFGALLEDVGYKGGNVIVEKNGEPLVAIVPTQALVVDTDIIVSGYLREINSPPTGFFRLWSERRFALIVSAPLQAEYQDVLLRPQVAGLLKKTNKK